MASLPSVHPSVRNPTMVTHPCLFSGKLHRQLRLTQIKRKFEDNKIQGQFMLCDQQRKKEQDD